MKNLVIFDLDGTLVNSVYDLADSVNFVLRENGYPTHETEKFYYFVGNGTRKLCERALPENKRTDAEIDRIHEQFLKRYAKNYLNKTVLYDGIKETVNSLVDRGVKCAVASNKTDIFTKEIIDKLFGSGVFSVVIGKREGYATKPDPKIVFEILERTETQKQNAIFVGDSDVDIKTAHNAGLAAVGCLWGFRTYDELFEAGAEYIIEKPAELLEILQEGISYDEL
ncbi:MAG: HAD family hydrolase [Ruminococcus sp.]|nr:HAD family hydrolase [Ruminococcus sp.]